ncbi:DUF3365 domain-containing protein [Sulfurimonas aquatica]|uniref:histidine kinase n=1 Tax=Sulfurimonas aquatica TaxID=2672570 RepID=A0A975AYD8_9BACT|nr:DUF3365 domain-containing protein [Sulfurimonas aquatica]QSZ40773.1 DUF3365 domain-containing protein [Sulfurimonas aquatica]
MLDSLLKKLQLLLGVTFLIGSILFYLILKDFHKEKADKSVQSALLTSQAMREYISKYQKPAIAKIVKENKLSEDLFDPALMSSTYIVDHVHNIYQKNYAAAGIHIYEDVNYKFASNNPTNINNKATPFESKILKKFNESNISSYKETIEYKGKETLFFAIPVTRNSTDCLQCHGDPKDAPRDMLDIYGSENGFYENIGEIRAINAMYSTLDANNAMLKVYFLVEAMMFIVFLGIYFTVRYFVIQLNDKDKFIAKQSKFAAMGEMISMIAHQWRQPLTGISMTTNNLLLDIELGAVDEKVLQDNLEIVNKQVEYLSHTIDDFKNFFRPDHKPEEVNIAALVKEACMVIDSSIKSAGMKIETEIDEKLTIVTLKNDVMQIILNLIKNSMDAYENNKISDRTIEIKVVNKPKRIELYFKDYAGGISKEIIDKIFDPYFSTKDKKTGTGLGLYMSKMITESHLSGYLDVESEAPSTTFKIALIKKGI